MIGRRRRSTLARKIFAAQLLVIVAGSATLALVALAVAPGRFDAHVRERLGVVPDDVAEHLHRAFGEAVLVALGIATLAAVVAAVAVSVVLAVWVARPLRALAATADRIAQGSYSVRIAEGGDGELAALGRSFNAMAAALETTERRRSELLADVAHELRTPTATIESHVEGLADGVIPAQADTWRTLQAETRRIGRLADDLHRVSAAQERRLEVEAEPLDVAGLVRERVASAAPRFAAKRVALDRDGEPRGLLVLGDRDRLGEALDNLLDNALRHTPAGGRVEVTARRRGHRAEIAVTDTGEGIEPGDVDRIFERFYRGDPARRRTGAGSGIGLTIARAIVEAHGGTLRAGSEGPGHGSRFVVELPLRRRPS